MVTKYKVPVFRSNVPSIHENDQIPHVEAYLQALNDMGVLTFSKHRPGGKGPIPYEFALTYSPEFVDSPHEARIDRTLRERYEAVQINVPWYHKV